MTRSHLNNFQSDYIGKQRIEIQHLTSCRCECGFLSHSLTEFIEHGVRDHQWNPIEASNIVEGRSKE